MSAIFSSLPWWVWVILALGMVLAVWAGINSKPRFSPKPVLTKNEMEFYNRLRRALPEYAVFPQVALRAFVKPGSPSGTRRYWRESGLLGAKHCDFLICHPTTLEVVTIIELDDRSHVKEQDEARDRMTAAAGYRTLRFESRKRPSVEQIRGAVVANA